MAKFGWEECKEEKIPTHPSKRFDREGMISRIKKKMAYTHSREVISKLSDSTTINIEGVHLTLYQGDICELGVDAIVNAANTYLRGGGGVDGFIHRAAGEEKLVSQMEKQYPKGCSYGECCMSESFKLPCAAIFHTVGPQECMNDPLLASCYTSCLDELQGLKMRSIAFPAISCGVFAYSEDIKRACKVAVDCTIEWIKQKQVKSGTTLKNVVFVCFSDDMYSTYKSYFRKLK
ncbi:O-acetyl-ADP-ribose deacetylase [Aduncisulcus paluster]|uniref:O-acetyl-ADP-ribose deacetylase n=1 Tax=Aduncisulcus paluster TaxID=2918883 RepID=A0ABQ5JZM0_9EUKA|nr:O-acetyl-ADP-ribose deacetylase [Aduncisulcus paluster]GKT27555.1 O-acetyl-ADP-ribose deacetylase [Aduncisulcus paluster]